MRDSLSELVSNVHNYSLPSVVEDWPGMISSDERKLLHHLASSHYSGEGVILDAGIFLGASTVAFCEGLAEQKGDWRVTQDGLRPVQSFEKAEWVSSGFDQYVSKIGSEFGLPPEGFRDGDDYSKFLQQMLSKYRYRFDLHLGNIESANLEGNPTVEIAFFDLLKNYRRDWEVFKKFGPCYIHGVTVIVHQDWFYEDALESKIRQEYLSDYFAFLGQVATSTIWLLVSPIPPGFFQEDFLPNISTEQGADLLEIAARRTPSLRHQLAGRLGVVAWRHRRDDFDTARRVLHEIDEEARALRNPRLSRIIGKFETLLR